MLELFKISLLESGFQGVGNAVAIIGCSLALILLVSFFVALSQALKAVRSLKTSVKAFSVSFDKLLKTVSSVIFQLKNGQTRAQIGD